MSKVPSKNVTAFEKKKKKKKNWKMSSESVTVLLKGPGANVQ